MAHKSDGCASGKQSSAAADGDSTEAHHATATSLPETLPNHPDARFDNENARWDAD